MQLITTQKRKAGIRLNAWITALNDKVQFSSVAQSCLTLATLGTAACQSPLSMGFSRQEYWSGLPFPSAGDLPDPGFKPVSPALAGRFFTTEPPGKPHLMHF